MAFHVVTPADLASAALVEDGPVEAASAALHLMAAALMLVLWVTRRSLFGLLCLGSIFMAGREIDLHKAFTTHGVFSLKQYSSAAVPAAEKLISAAVVAGLLVALVALTRGVWSEVRRLRRDDRPALAGLITLVAVLPVLKIIDGLPRYMRDWGLQPAEGLTAALLAVEEIGELGLPLITLTVALQLWRGLVAPEPLGIQSASATAWR
ncbi:MAG: hypothetical protein V7678_00280 [Brevundimonas sp.]